MFFHATGPVSIKPSPNAAHVEGCTAQALNPKSKESNTGASALVSDIQNASKQDGVRFNCSNTNAPPETAKGLGHRDHRPVKSISAGSNSVLEEHRTASQVTAPVSGAAEQRGGHPLSSNGTGLPLQAHASPRQEQPRTLDNARSPMRLRVKTPLCTSGCALSGRSTKSLDIMRKHLRCRVPVGPRVIAGSGRVTGGARGCRSASNKNKDVPASPLQQDGDKGAQCLGSKSAQRSRSQRIAARSNVTVGDKNVPKAELRSSAYGSDAQQGGKGAESRSNRSALTNEDQSLETVRATMSAKGVDMQGIATPTGQGASAQVEATPQVHVGSVVSEETAVGQRGPVDKAAGDNDSMGGSRRQSRPLAKILGVGVPKGDFGVGTWDDGDGGGENVGSLVDNVMFWRKGRNIPDEHDEEYDRGKVKKVRKNKHERILGPGKEKILQVQQSGNAGVQKAVPFKARSHQGPSNRNSAKCGRGSWGGSRGRGRRRGGRSMPSRRGSRGR